MAWLCSGGPPPRTSSSYTPRSRRPSPPPAWTSAPGGTCCSRSTGSTRRPRASWNRYRSPAALQGRWHCGTLDTPGKDTGKKRISDLLVNLLSPQPLMGVCAEHQGNHQVTDTPRYCSQGRVSMVSSKAVRLVPAYSVRLHTRNY